MTRVPPKPRGGVGVEGNEGKFPETWDAVVSGVRDGTHPSADARREEVPDPSVRGATGSDPHVDTRVDESPTKTKESGGPGPRRPGPPVRRPRRRPPRFPDARLRLRVGGGVQGVLRLLLMTGRFVVAVPTPSVWTSPWPGAVDRVRGCRFGRGVQKHGPVMLWTGVDTDPTPGDH